MKRSKITLLPTWWRLILLSMVPLFGSRTAFAQFAQGPVEVHVLLAPQPVTGSNGLVHVTYELHVTNFYQSTGTLCLKQVNVFADGTSLVLARFTAAQVNSLLAHPAEGEDTLGVPVEAGKRVVLFLWLKLPSGRPLPHMLRHQPVFPRIACKIISCPHHNNADTQNQNNGGNPSQRTSWIGKEVLSDNSAALGLVGTWFANHRLRSLGCVGFWSQGRTRRGLRQGWDSLCSIVWARGGDREET